MRVYTSMNKKHAGERNEAEDLMVKKSDPPHLRPVLLT